MAATEQSDPALQARLLESGAAGQTPVMAMDAAFSSSWPRPP
jgi:hypothetical protein